MHSSSKRMWFLTQNSPPSQTIKWKWGRIKGVSGGCYQKKKKKCKPKKGDNVKTGNRGSNKREDWRNPGVMVQSGTKYRMTTE